MLSNRTDSGVSPVVGVILLVGLTVALIAIISGILFEVGNSSVSTSPNIELEIIQLPTDNVEATIIQNENVDEVYLMNNDGMEIGGPRISSVGETYTLNPSTDNFQLGENVRVIVIMNDRESVLTTFETTP